jgi:hypothetical protein
MSQSKTLPARQENLERVTTLHVLRLNKVQGRAMARTERKYRRQKKKVIVERERELSYLFIQLFAFCGPPSNHKERLSLPFPSVESLMEYENFPLDDPNTQKMFHPHRPITGFLFSLPLGPPQTVVQRQMKNYEFSEFSLNEKRKIFILLPFSLSFIHPRSRRM